MSSERSTLITARPPGLVDVLDRILDNGLVIAGDIKVSLANVELLTLQIRLLVCSIDKAEQIGLNWWRYDTNLTTRAERARLKTWSCANGFPCSNRKSEASQRLTWLPSVVNRINLLITKQPGARQKPSAGIARKNLRNLRTTTRRCNPRALCLFF